MCEQDTASINENISLQGELSAVWGMSSDTKPAN